MCTRISTISHIASDHTPNSYRGKACMRLYRKLKFPVYPNEVMSCSKKYLKTIYWQFRQHNKNTYIDNEDSKNNKRKHNFPFHKDTGKQSHSKLISHTEKFARIWNYHIHLNQKTSNFQDQDYKVTDTHINTWRTVD